MPLFSTTCFGLRGHQHVKHENKRVYIYIYIYIYIYTHTHTHTHIHTVHMELRFQSLTLYVVMLVYIRWEEKSRVWDLYKCVL